jgi:hypothetical protein
MSAAQRNGSRIRGRAGLHDPLRYATAASRRAAEKTNAISSLQRAARRCAKHLGDGCAAALVDLVRAELGVNR